MTLSKCPTCEKGTLKIQNIKGRTLTWNYGLQVIVPKDFGVLCCDHCDEMLISLKDTRTLNDIIASDERN